MFIVDQYKNQQPKIYSDEEYLALQVWQLENVFHNNLGAIKDANLNYIAMSECYANEFEIQAQINQNDLGVEQNQLFNNDIKEQEQSIIDNQTIMDSIFFFKPSTAETLSCYAIRKRPIVNPTTNESIGLLIIAIKHKVGSFRTEYLKHIFRWSKGNGLNLPIENINQQQQKIIMCLLYGYHSRKEIATIISENTTMDINETRIKNLLSALYDKFNCNTTSQLIQQIMKQTFEFEVPIDLIKAGNYPIWQDS